MRKFNTAGPCIPRKHYMTDIQKRIQDIRSLVDEGAYFTINCARQYGKTTTLAGLAKAIEENYLVVSLDFQKFSQACFENESTFSRAFAEEFSREARRMIKEEICGKEGLEALEAVEKTGMNLRELFVVLLDFCEKSKKPVVLLIDEVDSASDNQVFLDFLAQLRNSYLDRELKDRAAFQSVILAGVYDVRNIRQKIRKNEEHKVNSPWNIAADFDVDMSFSKEEIAGMLEEYEEDHHTGMDVPKMAGYLYDYTAGYPFLISRLCKLIDKNQENKKQFQKNGTEWTGEGFHEAVRLILTEKNPLFDSLSGKLAEYPKLDSMLHTMLFTGKSIAYNPDDPAVDMAAMLGFIRNQDGNAVIANRIFETRLYNWYLSTAEMQEQEMYKASLLDKNQFVVEGHLNMRRVLEKFVEHFSSIYYDRDISFLEEEGRKYFLLYLRPIINGAGNYYIESRTRELRRTDVIVDYRGEQYVIEMKIWRGEEYNRRGREQLIGYLNDYGKQKGYLISFNFNKKKQIGVYERFIGGKMIIEAVV